ncbi:cyclin-T isoform X2 [Aedes aegypti]|uniref:Cyclin-like domain-containing protein n=1 Tax=Aedes aegypti TaxID=7159 RepID=A0A903U190_AEDAE|nr:cyclin-T isoform X2 [Aedes aegypti]
MASGAGGAGPSASSGSSGSNSSSGTLARDDSKWYFTAEQLANSPSRKCGMDADQELMYRQRAANLIQDMGQRLQVSQLCINTAIVYMHRFYAFHSFTQFHRNSIAAAALFLAAKVEEQPRKLEHIIKVVHICLGMEAPDPLKENYAEQAQDLVFNENVLLQTLGFDVAIDHPHTHVVKTCHLVKASKDLAQTSYFMASNSLHLTTMCLQYKPTVVACFCIHLACKWSRWEIPQSNEGRHWFHYVDKSVTLDLLKQLTDEFLHIFDRCPTRLKSKMKSIRAEQPQADDSSRRSSSAMPSSSSSAIARGLDDAGPSSSHHRSSSHSHSKQSSSSGDPSLKASQSSSSSHKIPSSSGSSRSRGERPPSSSAQALHQREMMAGAGGHYGASGSSSSKMQPMPHHSSSRSSGMPPQSSSSSSSSSRYGGNLHEGSRDPKNRMMPTAAAGSSSSSIPMHPYGQSKVDRHSVSSGQKGPSLMDSKNQGKSQSSIMAAPLFSGSSNPDLSSRSSASMMKQPSSASYGSHPPSYSQSMSNRNNMPSNESVPNQQPQFKNQMQPQLPSAGSESSSFRLIDDSNRLTEPMQICTPPKQSSKPSSIFSPDWKDTQADSNNANVSNSGGKSRSQGQANVQKAIKESPSSKEKKPLAAGYPDQQQKSRSITPKKERRTEAVTTTPSGSQSKSSNEKKPSSTSSSLKRTLDVTPTGAMSLESTDLLGINKLSSGQAPMKRSHPSSEQVRQEDGTDFREFKVRKVEIPSPSENLFASSFDLSSTFDKQDDSFSMFSFHDPGSLLSQPLLSDSKPANVGKTSFSNTINGIETNPALVSSLLKESLCSTESKFGTLNANSSGSNSATNAPGASTTSSSTIMGTGSSTAPSQSVSSLSASSAPSIASNVPETIKIKSEAPSSLDVNAPSAISSLLAQSAPILSTAPALINPSMGSASSELTTLTGDAVSALTKEEEHRRSKSEKKKKKDKHKHKEKDKSKDKDREERKKHKKDKDRHRDREREKSEQASDAALVPGPIKIKLPKDKLNLHPLTAESTTGGNPAPAADMGLKIKIPKDRLSGASSISGSATGGPVAPAAGGGSAPGGQSAPTNPLKLKISKDKIEHYNISDGGFNNGSGHGHGGSHHGHSNKKKDRDKERDKSKSSKSSTGSLGAAAVAAATAAVPNDYNKQNGNGGGGGSSAASGGQTTGNSSSKSSSSKQSALSAQQQYSLKHMTTTEQQATGGPQHPASFDYMQHAQAPTLQQQQYFSQFGAFNAQQQQQQNVLLNSATKMSGNNLGTSLPNFYYGTSNQNNGNNTIKK